MGIADHRQLRKSRSRSLEHIEIQRVSGNGTNMVYPIDLPTALRLAGAQNLDIQIAREHLNEALANREKRRQRVGFGMRNEPVYVLFSALKLSAPKEHSDGAVQSNG